MAARRRGGGVDLRWTGRDEDLRRAFAWLARTGVGVRFGSRPVGWYQQHNMAAIDAIEAAAKAADADVSSVSVRDGYVYAGSKRLGTTQSFYDAADRRVRS